MKTVYELIQEGHYNNTMVYPRKDTTSLLYTERTKYRAENQRLDDTFRSDLSREHGLENHPKEDLLWQLAWDYGHSSGYSEVCSYYGDLAELLKY